MATPIAPIVAVVLYHRLAHYPRDDVDDPERDEQHDEPDEQLQTVSRQPFEHRGPELIPRPGVGILRRRSRFGHQLQNFFRHLCLLMLNITIRRGACQRPHGQNEKYFRQNP